jgi:hypothetical protein
MTSGGNVLIGTTANANGRLQVLGADNAVISQIKSASGMVQIYPYYSAYGGPIIQALDGGAVGYVPLRIEASSTTFSGSVRVSGGNLQIDNGFQRMYTYYIVVGPSSTGTITISSPTGTNMQGSMQVMAGGYGNGITGNITGLWMVGGLLFFNNASTSTITQIVNSVTDFGSMSFQRSSDQYTVTLTNTASSGSSTKTFYVSVIINGA